jgi:hypothetical protein
VNRTDAGERVCLACRVTVLSRYNPDPLCSVCERASRNSAGIVPTWLWDSGPMRAALARVDLAAFVAIFRAAAGLSQTELGNLIDGWSQSLVSLTERGLRDTLYDIRKLLAFADTVGMPRTALLPLVLGQSDAILESDNSVALRGVDAVDMTSSDVHHLDGRARRLGPAARPRPGRPGARAVPAGESDPAAHPGRYGRRRRPVTAGPAALRACPQDAR